jgi:host factor-I protein
MMVKNQINIQDQFLNRVRRDRNRVTVELIGGQKVEGMIMGFDNFSLILRVEGDQLIYKHAISSISLGEKMEFQESK